MPGFLYYINVGAEQITPAAIRAAGLGYALDGCDLCRRGVAAGPDNARGVVLADGRRVPTDLLGYFPDKQTWRKIQGSGVRGQGSGSKTPRDCIAGEPPQPWLGWYPDQQPTPADLARPQQLSGHDVTLLDGNRWQVPIARGWKEEDGDLRWYHNVPQALELDTEGRWQNGSILPQYADLWALALRWDDARNAALAGAAAEGKTAASMEFDDVVDAASQALGANYAVGRDEISALKLLTVDLALEVLGALVDLPTRMAWIKKKLASETPAGESTVVGSPDSTAATDPPSPTCGPWAWDSGFQPP